MSVPTQFHLMNPSLLVPSPVATPSLSTARPVSRPRLAAWQRGLLLLAAAWNLLGGASALSDPAGHFASMYHAPLPLDSSLVLFFYRCTWINVLAWGAGYAIAAFHPASRLAVLAAGGLGKLVYFAATVSLFASGAGRVSLLATGLFDVGLAAIFAWVLFSGRAAARV